MRARVQIQESPAPLCSVLQDLFASLCKFLFVSFRKLSSQCRGSKVDLSMIFSENGHG